MSSITTSRPLRALSSAVSYLTACSPEALPTHCLLTLNHQLSVSNAELEEDRPHCCWCSPKKPSSSGSQPAQRDAHWLSARSLPGHDRSVQFLCFDLPRSPNYSTGCSQQSGTLLQLRQPNSPANVPLESCWVLLEPPKCPWSPLLLPWTHFSASVLLVPHGSHLLETFLRELLVGHWSCFNQTLRA